MMRAGADMMKQQLKSMFGIETNKREQDEIEYHCVNVVDSWAEATKEPWSKWELFKADPKQFMFSVGGIPALISMAIWTTLAFIPNGSLRYPCALLGWPTPEILDNTVESHKGAVMSLLSEIQTSMGITKDRIITLGAAASS